MPFARHLRFKFHGVTHGHCKSSDNHTSCSPIANPPNLEPESPQPSITVHDGTHPNPHASTDVLDQLSYSLPPQTTLGDIGQNNRQWATQPPNEPINSLNAPAPLSRETVQHDFHDTTYPQGSLHIRSRSDPHSKSCKVPPNSSATVAPSSKKSTSNSDSNSNSRPHSQDQSPVCKDVTIESTAAEIPSNSQNADSPLEPSDEELTIRARLHPSSAFTTKFPAAVNTVHHRLSKSGSASGPSHPGNLLSATKKPGRLRADSAPSSMPTATARRRPDYEARGDNVSYTCATCGHTNACGKMKKGFRCGKCAMINDLQAYKEKAKPGSNENYFGRPLPWNRVAPISLQVTRSIIDKCLRTYFEHILRQVDSRDYQRTSLTPAHHKSTDATRPSRVLVPTQSRGPRGSCSASGKPPAVNNVKCKTSFEAGTHTGSPKSSPSTVPPVMYPHDISPEHPTESFGPDPSSKQDSAKVEELPFVDHTDISHNNHRHSSFSFSPHRSSVIFRPLTGYLNSSFNGCDTLNSSFLTAKSDPLSTDSNGKNGWGVFVSTKSPRIDWSAVHQWYDKLMNVGAGWEKIWHEMKPEDADPLRQKWEEVNDNVAILKQELRQATMELRMTLLIEMENVLIRPQRPLKTPDDMRFLLILLENPLLRLDGPGLGASKNAAGNSHHDETNRSVKRILGIVAHLDKECHHVLRSWFSRYDEGKMRTTVEIIGRFLTTRLLRLSQRQSSKVQRRRPRGDSGTADNVAGNSTMDALVPTLSVENATRAQVHEAISRVATSPSADGQSQETPAYVDDWQIHVAAIVMSLLFSANSRAASVASSPSGGAIDGGGGRHNASAGNNIVPISTFYNTLLDYSDVIKDFEAWESHSRRFTFCQYPFLLSLWAKIRILESDARRQMAERARQAFFTSVFGGKIESQYIVLKVRRECLVEDSLAGVGEVVTAGGQDLKKGLRIEFKGEAGIDAGGLRKEWFLMLTRDIFNPLHGLFVYDEDSRYCYFNPHCLESSEQFYLVGILLGLAIYNSTILDIALPPFLFRKLIASMPVGFKSTWAPTAAISGRTRAFRPTLSDLAEFRPELARGLQQLLEYEGNVKDTFSLDFMMDVERFGEHSRVPLCPQGDKRAVTNNNRREYVDLYVRHILDDSVAQQFDPFRAGFFTVCGGNSLHLFSSEEIELLVRGSGGDESLDIPSLRAVAVYENWHGVKNPATEEPVVRWFWDFCQRSAPQEQRQILSFITGSDRIPAMGATNLVIRIACLGDAGAGPHNAARSRSAERGKANIIERFPTARTCFNMLGLWRYRDGPEERKRFEEKFWRAVVEGEGFGLK